MKYFYLSCVLLLCLFSLWQMTVIDGQREIEKRLYLQYRAADHELYMRFSPKWHYSIHDLVSHPDPQMPYDYPDEDRDPCWSMGLCDN